MFHADEMIANSACSGHKDQHPHTILYNILSRRDSDRLNGKRNSYFVVHNCLCKQRKVCLKDPKATCQVAAGVLIKSVCFMRSLPCFNQLPPGDQSSLLRHGWVPLFLLGLAQERTVFEVTDAPNSSILRRILLRPGLSEKEADQPTLAGVHRLRACLRQLRDLDLSPKEYAYLRGAVLFNPVVHGLSATWCIEGLQQEAQRALQEVVGLLHPDDAGRFRHILLVASATQNVSHDLVAQLFFKPLIGNANIIHLLTDMLICPMRITENVLTFILE
ncbi:nuclear receptor subfamily 0 group B member 2 [Scophthalmus maximus]|uniref:nuclear receptor subfamily 0 group B member 2 n=1 Tax=Scophthalmus maximus TaxID=52904 RepID=UPI000F3A4CEC|nr:nuclear receptor subfamily 0 group B member 2 [Scophthalmus maximus]XP_035489836.2 nuclear receptor subfamily 0 group B member 2 [Scophthalmus maximus]